MDKEIIVDGKPVTLRLFTVKDKIEIDRLQRRSAQLDIELDQVMQKQDAAGIVSKEGEKMDCMWGKYFKILTAGTNLKQEEIEALTSNSVDNLMISVLDYNKPPLELLERLSTLSTQASTQS